MFHKYTRNNYSIGKVLYRIDNIYGKIIIFRQGSDEIVTIFNFRNDVAIN